MDAAVVFKCLNVFSRCLGVCAVPRFQGWCRSFIGTTMHWTPPSCFNDAVRGADGRTLAVAEKLNHLEYLESQTPKPSSTVSLEKEEVLWRTSIDTFYFKLGGQVHLFLLMLDEKRSLCSNVCVHSDEDHQKIYTSEAP